jgi:uncharacterized protein (TIGR03437 family)
VSCQLPTSLGGLSVTIDGQPTYISYAGPGQINVLMPADATLGTVPVQVTTPQGQSCRGAVMLQRLAPQLFTRMVGDVTYAAAEHGDYSPVGPSPAPLARLSCCTAPASAQPRQKFRFRRPTSSPPF